MPSAANTAAKLVGFAAALAVVFGLATVAGATLGPDRDGRAAAETDHGSMAAGPMTPGLSVAEGDLRLDLRTPELPRGTTGALRFAVLGADGRPVREFDLRHTKRMHLILARRDLTGFQHLHPEQAADGTWSAPARIDAAGSYRVFADFAHDGQATTLATDLRVDGPAELQPLPPPATAAVSDGGYDVTLAADNTRAGREAELRFTVRRNGRPVDVDPYLGADGHLVALRDGDLAFTHVHPTEDGHGDVIGFGATFPTAGDYRLFLQFQHAGRVQTVAFTQSVGP